MTGNCSALVLRHDLELVPCEPYRAKITAKACATFYLLANKRRPRSLHIPWPMRGEIHVDRAPSLDREKCIGCKVGRARAAALGLVRVEQPKRTGVSGKTWHMQTRPKPGPREYRTVKWGNGAYREQKTKLVGPCLGCERTIRSGETCFVGGSHLSHFRKKAARLCWGCGMNGPVKQAARPVRRGATTRKRRKA